METKRGVSYTFLEVVLTQDPRYYEGITTSDIKSKIVMPDTAGGKCAYVDLYEGKRDTQGRLYVAPATAFISHAWMYNFNIPLDVMKTHHNKNANSYFWYDVFINNQHTLGQTDLGAAFSDAIEEIGTVLCVISPWNNPIPLRRAWCLWEIFTSIKLGKKVQFRVCLPSSERAALKAGIAESFGSILDALLSIDARKAEAKVESELVMIKAAVEKEVGFDNLNNVVKDQLRKWYVETGADMADVIIRAGGEEAESESATEIFGSYLYNLSTVLITFHQLEKALLFLNRSASIYKAVLGCNHPRLGAVYNNIGHIYREKGDIDTAVTFHELALSVEVSSYGPDHFEVAVTYHNLGVAYFCKGDNARSIEYHEKSLKINLIQLPPLHPNTGAVYLGLGNICMSTGEFSRALDYYKLHLEVCLETVGEPHLVTGKCLNNIGLAYAFLDGHNGNAMGFYKQSLKIKNSLLGSDHPATQMTQFNLSASYKGKQSVIKYVDSCVICFDMSKQDNFVFALPQQKNCVAAICASCVQTLAYQDANFECLPSLLVE